MSLPHLQETSLLSLEKVFCRVTLKVLWAFPVILELPKWPQPKFGLRHVY